MPTEILSTIAIDFDELSTIAVDFNEKSLKEHAHYQKVASGETRLKKKFLILEHHPSQVFTCYKQGTTKRYLLPNFQFLLTMFRRRGRSSVSQMDSAVFISILEENLN